MVKSMTGYGRAVETVNGREFTVELRSVNNRYLDCSVKLPRSLTFAEEAVKQAVKATISRGKVDVFITVRSEGTADVKITLNAAMVEGYLAAMKQMVADYGVQDDISVSVISRMPEVFTVEKPEVDEEQLLADRWVWSDRLWPTTMPCAQRKVRLWKMTFAAVATPSWNWCPRWRPETARLSPTTAPDWRTS